MCVLGSHLRLFIGIFFEKILQTLKSRSKISQISVKPAEVRLLLTRRIVDNLLVNPLITCPSTCLSEEGPPPPPWLAALTIISLFRGFQTGLVEQNSPITHTRTLTVSLCRHLICPRASSSPLSSRLKVLMLMAASCDLSEGSLGNVRFAH